MTKKKRIDNSWVPRRQIKDFLNREIIEPFLRSYSQDSDDSLKLSNAILLLKVSEDLISDFVKNEVHDVKNFEKRKEIILFLGYLGKILQSSIVLVGVTDYLGAMVLFRAIFELLVGISTKVNGSMKKRIFSIDFINLEEKEFLYELWNDLSAWAHPHGRWLKNVCPIFYGIGRHYHRDFFQKCLKYSDGIIDLMLTITIELFRVSPHSFLDKIKEFLEFSEIKMFTKRLTEWEIGKKLHQDVPPDL